MSKHLALFFFLLAGCGAKTAIQVTVDADSAALQNNEILSLRVVLTQNGDSGVETFDNKGDPIDFPVTLSTRVDAARLGDIRISVAGLDADNRAVLGGFSDLELAGAEVQAANVIMNSTNPCVADGIDEGCCTNFLDDDGNGLADCADLACADAFKDLCEGSECGDGDQNVFAAEECDDGNNTPGDGCDQNCVSEDKLFSGFFEFSQVDELEFGTDFSGVTNNAFQVQDGFVVETVDQASGCTRLDIQVPARNASNADFFFANYGNFEAFDGANNQVVSEAFPDPAIIFEPFTAVFADNEPARLEFQGGANTEFAQPKVIFDGNFPTKLTVGVGEAATTMIRGQDFVVNWTPTNSGEDTVVAVFSGTGLTQIYCQVPESDGEVIIPAAFTQSFNRGPQDFALATGFSMEILHGEILEIPVDPQETQSQLDNIQGKLFLIVGHGTFMFGEVF